MSATVAKPHAPRRLRAYRRRQWVWRIATLLLFVASAALTLAGIYLALRHAMGFLGPR